jgi:hypothetical protein
MSNDKVMSINKEILKNLIDLYEGQITQLTVLSKIELGNDVIEEINKLKSQLLNNDEKPVLTGLSKILWGDDNTCSVTFYPKDDEQAIIDYNKMEEESEMENYNEMKDEQDKIN